MVSSNNQNTDLDSTVLIWMGLIIYNSENYYSISFTCKVNQKFPSWKTKVSYLFFSTHLQSTLATYKSKQKRKRKKKDKPFSSCC